MSPIHPLFLERELKRCMRPNPHLFVRPDWRRFVRPGFEDAHPFAFYERKYRPDQPRVPPGSREGGQWTSEGGSGDDDLPANAKPTQFNADERSPRSDSLIQLGGEDLGSFGNGVSIAKGPNIAHQESFDPESGVTTLSFTGIGLVVVDEKIDTVVTGSTYTVGTPTRPDEGLSITIDLSGKVLVYPTFGG